MATARRRVRPIAEAIADRTTGHSIDLLRFDAGIRRQARNQLRLLETDLVDKLNRLDPTSPKRLTTRVQRMERLLKETRESIRGSYARVRETTKGALYDLAPVESEFLKDSINRPLRIELATATPSAATLRSLVNGTLIEGTPLNEWWGNQRQTTRRLFEGQMRQGILAGEDLGALRQRVRGRHTGRFVKVDGRRVGVYSGGIMDISRRNADTLIRTATQSVSNDVRAATIDANNDLIKGRQTLSTLDGRTSPICIARSGWAWLLDGSPVAETGANIRYPGPPPWHPNCRTTEIPLLRSWEELSGPNSTISSEKLRRLETAGRRTQASMDGQVSSGLNYERWLRGKSEAFQNKVLGRGKADLWRAGGIKSLSQLIDQTGRPITLAQFQARAGFKARSATAIPAAELANYKVHQKLLERRKALNTSKAAGSDVAAEIKENERQIRASRKLGYNKLPPGLKPQPARLPAPTTTASDLQARADFEAAVDGRYVATWQAKGGAAVGSKYVSRARSTTNLQKVEVTDGEHFCGPAAVAAVTGAETGVAANAFRASQKAPSPARITATIGPATANAVSQFGVRAEIYKVNPLGAGPATKFDSLMDKLPEGRYIAGVDFSLGRGRGREAHWVSVSKTRDGGIQVADNGSLFSRNPQAYRSADGTLDITMKAEIKARRVTAEELIVIRNP